MGSTVLIQPGIALLLRTLQPPPPLRQNAQESQHLRVLLSLCHPAVQGSLRHHDTDKDGLLSASDLVAAFGAHGKSIGSGDAQAMLDEVDGPMNFTQMVTLFATKMAGGSDDDDVILASFEAFEMDGKIDADAFRHSLMTFGVKFSASEVDDAFAEFKIDDGQIDAAHLKGLMVSK